MSFSRLSSYRWLSGVLLIVGTLGLPIESRAQGGVGAGPLTGTLTDTEPTVGVLSWGIVKLAPGITISQIGVDSNIFHEKVNPKEDFIIAGKPDLAAFSQTRFLKLSTYIGGDFSYFHKYTEERSVGYDVRARAEILLSRLFPFVAYGQTKSRERPNSEIDTRADSVREELTGGLGFELSDTSSMFVSASRNPTKYQESFEEGVDLGQSLNRHTDDYGGGVRTALTPLTTITLRGGYRKDVFDSEPIRNSEATSVHATLDFAPQAVVTGTATIGYQNSDPVDPKIDPYRGVVGSGSLTFPILEYVRLNFAADRSTEYSFDTSEAYFVSTSLNVAASFRIVGAVDVQVTGRRALADYGFREGVADRVDTTDTLTGGLGYNLRNRTRLALSYEYSRRRSPALPDQNYEGRRIFFSWTYAF